MRATTHHGWLPAVALLCGEALSSGCEADRMHDEWQAVEVPPDPHDEAAVREEELARRITEVPAAASPPVLDAEADAAFRRAPVQNIARVVRGARPDAADLTATWRALHDATALYLLVEVTDAHLVVDSDASSPWEDDAVEIFLDADVSGGTTYDGVDDVQLVVRPGDPRVLLGLRSAPVRAREIGYRSRRLAQGYAVELRIPWSAVHTRWRRGKTLGLDVHVDDDDGVGRESKLTWWSLVVAR